MTLKLNSVRDAVRKGVYLDKVLNFPVPSELDRQFLEIEKQQELIREQTKHIEDAKLAKFIEDLYK
jgi:hypothetical protein|tara:strand:- start:841 stop:1038 length:198 start_codon:yes stop_codon:yes gene_type:complete